MSLDRGKEIQRQALRRGGAEQCGVMSLRVHLEVIGFRPQRRAALLVFIERERDADRAGGNTCGCAAKGPAELDDLRDS
jgi:hypothetical protein